MTTTRATTWHAEADNLRCRRVADRRDAGHGSPFPPSSLPAYFFTCILNCTKKQGSLFFFYSRSKQHACIFMGYECAATNQATTQRPLGYSGRGERDLGGHGRRKGVTKEMRNGSSRDGCFYFPFHISTRLFRPSSRCIGGSNKNAQGDSKPKGPVHCGRGREAGKPRGVGFL